VVEDFSEIRVRGEAKPAAPAPAAPTGASVVKREDIERRLLELQQQQQQAIANVQAIAGAIQECQHWLDRIAAEDAAAAKAAKPAEPAKPK
jgi:hypothetical protein